MALSRPVQPQLNPPKVAVALPMRQLQEFCQRWQITELALFGSVLRPDFHPDSDIDVLVTFAATAQRGLTETLQMRDELQQLFNRKVDLIVKAALKRSDNWLRRQNILDSAQVIYTERSCTAPLIPAL
jgi:predicted nucleotidyltransferase